MTGPLLDENHDTISNKIDHQLIKESEMFRLTMFGDGDTTLRAPFINKLTAGVHDEAALLDIDDCTGNVTKGFKKDAEDIAKLLIPHMEMLDPEKQGALNLLFPLQHLTSTSYA